LFAPLSGPEKASPVVKSAFKRASLRALCAWHDRDMFWRLPKLGYIDVMPVLTAAQKHCKLPGSAQERLSPEKVFAHASSKNKLKTKVFVQSSTARNTANFQKTHISPETNDQTTRTYPFHPMLFIPDSDMLFPYS